MAKLKSWTRSEGKRYQIKILRTKGEPWQKRKHSWSPLFDYQSVVACMKVTKKGESHCRVAHFLLERKKVRGGRWSSWGYGAIGEEYRMRCENLKKSRRPTRARRRRRPR